MFGFLRRHRDREVAEIEALIESDLDQGFARFVSTRSRLTHEAADRLGEALRRRLEGREHEAYLARALAEGAIGPTASLELLEAYRDAGYVTDERAEMHRRHAIDAHRRELLALMARPDTGRFEYFQLLDGYRTSGYLTEDELRALYGIVEAKLNPEAAAKRLFAEAQVALDPELQAELLHRYLMRFQGAEDYAVAASQYLALRVDLQWRRLHRLTSARDATRQIHELNSLLEAYLPHTSDLSEYVPIDQIVEDFHAHARHFDAEPGADDLITEEDVSRRVVVVAKHDGSDGSYREERNRLVPMGATGRVRAVKGDKVLVRHAGPGLEYSRSWPLPPMDGVRKVAIPRDSDLALWDQDEVGLMNPRRPSPVFVHQYQAAVETMARILERHREDHSIRLIESGEDADGDREAR